MATDFVVKVGAEFDTSSLSKFKDEVDKSTTKAKSLGDILSSIPKSALAIGAAFAGVGLAIANTANKLNDLAEAAGKLGVGADWMKKIADQAAVSDTNFETVNNSLKLFQDNLGNIGDASQKSSQLLKAAGVTASDSLEEATKKQAIFLQGIGDINLKAAAGREAFGKQYTEIAATLENVANAAKSVKEEIGFDIDPNLTKNVGELFDTFDAFAQVVEGFIESGLETFIPLVSNSFQVLLDWLKKNADTVGALSDLFKFLGFVIGKIIQAAVAAFIGFNTVIATVGKTIGAFAAAIVAALSGNITGAVQIVKDSLADTDRALNESADSIRHAFDDTYQKAVDTDNKRVASNDDAAKKIMAGNKKVTDEAAKEYAKQERRYLEFAAKIKSITDDMIAKRKTALESLADSSNIFSGLRTGSISLSDIPGIEVIQSAIADTRESVKGLNAELTKMGAGSGVNLEKIIDDARATLNQTKDYAQFIATVSAGIDKAVADASQKIGVGTSPGLIAARDNLVKLGDAFKQLPATVEAVKKATAGKGLLDVFKEQEAIEKETALIAKLGADVSQIAIDEAKINAELQKRLGLSEGQVAQQAQALALVREQNKLENERAARQAKFNFDTNVQDRLSDQEVAGMFIGTEEQRQRAIAVATETQRAVLAGKDAVQAEADARALVAQDEQLKKRLEQSKAFSTMLSAALADTGKTFTAALDKTFADGTASWTEFRDNVTDGFRGLLYNLGKQIVESQLTKLFQSIFDSDETAKAMKKVLEMTIKFIGEMVSQFLVLIGVKSVAGVAAADGAVMIGGNVTPFARGGVVSSPTVFPMANGGMGLMGEAGPEAIMPLKRTATGKLGVQVSGKSNGGNTQNVVTNITINGDVTNDNADVISRQVNEQVRAIIQQELRVQSRPGNQLNRAPSYM